MDKQDVLFVLSIDTEEEWEWSNDFPESDCSVKNIEKLPAFQTFCESLHIKPTYFVDYAVADDDYSSDVLRQFASQRNVEIGAHLHPWCNPPFFGKTDEAKSHVVNLPRDQVKQKLDSLVERLITNIGPTPVSFRSGRWGINGSTLQLLAERGFSVDSSVYPFYENSFFSCKNRDSTPYWPSFENADLDGVQRNLLELPVTAGFNRSHFKRADNIHTLLAKSPLNLVKPVGLLWHTKLLRKLYLSPELTDSTSMKMLIDMCLEKQYPVIHMYLHSSSLLDGVTGLLQVDNAYSRICKRMTEVIQYLNARANVRFCTISEAATLLKHKHNSCFSLQD
jgi:hypothetical protein